MNINRPPDAAQLFLSFSLVSCLTQESPLRPIKIAGLKQRSSFSLVSYLRQEDHSDEYIKSPASYSAGLPCLCRVGGKTPASVLLSKLKIRSSQ